MIGGVCGKMGWIQGMGPGEHGPRCSGAVSIRRGPFQEGALRDGLAAVQGMQLRVLPGSAVRAERAGFGARERRPTLPLAALTALEEDSCATGRRLVRAPSKAPSHGQRGSSRSKVGRGLEGARSPRHPLNHQVPAEAQCPGAGPRETQTSSRGGGGPRLTSARARWLARRTLARP